MAHEQNITKHNDDGSETQMVLVEKEYLSKLQNRLDSDSQLMQIACLEETLRMRNERIIKLLGICTKLLGEWINLLPKRVRYKHHTDLVDEAEEIVAETTRLVESKGFSK